MDDLQFRQLLDYFCYSWDGYRRVRKGVKKEEIKQVYTTAGSAEVSMNIFYILDRDAVVRQQCECFNDRFCKPLFP